LVARQISSRTFCRINAAIHLTTERRIYAAVKNSCHAPAWVSTLRISPGAHSASTSKGRQQTSQSVVKRWLAMLVSITNSKSCPQNGHWTEAELSTCQTCARLGRLSRGALFFGAGRF